MEDFSGETLLYDSPRRQILEVKDEKGEEVQCHFSRLFPIHYLYLQRKPEIPEVPLIEMVGPPRDAHSCCWPTLPWTNFHSDSKARGSCPRRRHRGSLTWQQE